MTNIQLNKGIALAKAGKSLEARHVLGQVVTRDPRSVRGWLWLAGVVETEEQQRYCLERVLHLNPQDEVCKRLLTQMKSGIVNGIPISAADETDNGIIQQRAPIACQPSPQAPVSIEEQASPHPASDTAPTDEASQADDQKPSAAGSAAPSSHYFVGHQPKSSRTKNLEDVIANVFVPLGYEPQGVDRVVGGEPYLLHICKEIFSTSFGVFDLSSDDPNSYLELGIALGLNCPIIVLANFKACLPPALKNHNIIVYTDRADLEAKLVRLCEQGFPPPTPPTPDHCYFCDRICDSMSTPPDENSYLVLHHSKLLWRNLMKSLTPHLAEYHLYPGYLSGRTSGATLCDMRRKVLASQFVLCHPGTLCDKSGFLALGIAIGSRVPWILLTKEGQAAIPSDLQGVDRIEYTNVGDLGGLLIDTLGGFLGRVMPSPPVKNNGTALLSLPFWIQLEDWIGRAKQPEQAPERPQGSIQLAQYDGQTYLTKHVVPKGGLLFGRSPECDVVVQNPSASARHFRILRGRTGKTFVEDLHSKNGTFLNGTRLPPGKRVEIKLNDTVRIPGARILVWDDRPVPREQEPPQTFDNTAMLPPVLRIEIPDVPPPTYLSTWDHLLTLTVILPDGRHHTTFEVQAYYPMDRILSKLVDLLDLPRGQYHFKLEDKYVADDETPLSLGLGTGDALTIAPEEVNSGKFPPRR
jgi:hypothetical protein